MTLASSARSLSTEFSAAIYFLDQAVCMRAKVEQWTSFGLHLLQCFLLIHFHGNKYYLTVIDHHKPIVHDTKIWSRGHELTRTYIHPRKCTLHLHVNTKCMSNSCQSKKTDAILWRTNQRIIVNTHVFELRQWTSSKYAPINNSISGEPQTQCTWRTQHTNVHTHAGVSSPQWRNHMWGSVFTFRFWTSAICCITLFIAQPRHY